MGNNHFLIFGFLLLLPSLALCAYPPQGGSKNPPPPLPPAAVNCATQAEGVGLTKPGQCVSSFTKCAYGRAYPHQCPSGLFFNVATNQCDYKHHIAACGGVPPPPPLDCSGRKDGLYAENDCGSPVFYSCHSGISNKLNCPPGTIFEQKSSQCQFSSRCEKAGDSNPAQAGQPGPAAPASPPAAPSPYKMSMRADDDEEDENEEGGDENGNAEKDEEHQNKKTTPKPKDEENDDENGESDGGANGDDGGDGEGEGSENNGENDGSEDGNDDGGEDENGGKKGNGDENEKKKATTQSPGGKGKNGKNDGKNGDENEGENQDGKNGGGNDGENQDGKNGGGNDGENGNGGNEEENQDQEIQHDFGNGCPPIFGNVFTQMKVSSIARSRVICKWVIIATGQNNCPEFFQQCDTSSPQCQNRQNEIWWQCTSFCEPSCGNRKPNCRNSCGRSGCQCFPGFYRNQRGVCVSASQCPGGNSRGN